MILSLSGLPEATPDEELSRNRRVAVLLIACMGLFVAGLDVTVVNVALPSIASSLHSSVSGLQWTVGAYTLVMAGLMMLFGSAGDRWGRKRILVTGLAVFSAGSLASSLASSVAALVAFRAVQAVGGAMLNPVAVSIITNTFTDPRERAQAGRGPAGHAHLRDHRGAGTRMGLPCHHRLFRCRGRLAGRPGPAREPPGRAADRPAVLPVGPVQLGKRDRRARLRCVRRGVAPEHPLPSGRALPLASAGRPGDAAAGGDGDGRIAGVGPPGGQPRAAAGAHGLRVSSVTGCAVLAGLTGTTAYPQLLAGYVLFGFGFGLVNTPVTNTAVSGMPRAQAGVAAAIASSSRQFGQTLGVAVAGAIVAGGAAGSLRVRFLPASHAAWWTLMACSGLVLVLGYLAGTRRAAESARHVAAALNPEALIEHTH